MRLLHQAMLVFVGGDNMSSEKTCDYCTHPFYKKLGENNMCTYHYTCRIRGEY